jgi:hypothetical protein
MIAKASKIKTFLVQFEIEFDDEPSDNMVMTVYAENEPEALLRASKDTDILEKISQYYKPKNIQISPQLAWED